MTTEITTLHIRRATPLDAVNVYRLLVDEEKRAGMPEDTDQAARIAHVLNVIDSGYTTVAVVSGRVVGSVGALPLSQALAGAFLALSPSFHDTKVGIQLLAGLVRFAESQSLSLRFSLSLPVPKYVQHAFEQVGGFMASTVTYERKSNDVETSAKPDDFGRLRLVGATSISKTDASADTSATRSATQRDRDERADET